MKSYPQITVDGKQRREHVVIAEKALGRPLPKGAEVHHVDGNKTNNKHDNLVICESTAYHNLLHRRTRIIRLGGDPNIHRACAICKKLKDIQEYGKDRNGPDGFGAVCKLCNCANSRKYR